EFNHLRKVDKWSANGRAAMQIVLEVQKSLNP
ncbi:hypothetical protein EVA_14377, partial [gut metagenome]